MIHNLSAAAVVFVPRPEATGVADAMLHAEYDTSLPVFHPFARMAMCQKASTGVQKPTLSCVLVLRVVAVVTWCSGSIDELSWGGREVPNGCWWTAVSPPRKRIRMTLTPLSSSHRIVRSSLRTNMP
jgi:hypothetical protein